MSNRQFKTLLSKDKYVLFDYGQLQHLPQIDKQLAGICKVQDIFYIKQRNSENWHPLIAEQLLINVVYNIDDVNDQYWWIYKYNNQTIGQDFDFQSKKCNNFDQSSNHLFIWKHNQQKYIDCSFFRTVDNGESYRKINLPYQHIDNNTIIADFTGFTAQNQNQNQSFYISCK